MIPEEIARTIVDPKAYADGKRVDDAFALLRREMPLAVAQPEGYDPFWVVTKYADILEVERQNELFHNGARATTLVTIDIDARIRQLMGGSPHLVKSLVQMDDPEHGGYRRLTQPYFLAQNLKKLEARVREIARAAIDRMAGMGGVCDFARDIAFLYPLHVIMEVLGVPEIDEPPSYFTRETRQSSEMDWFELRNYIAKLRHSGFDVARFSVQLHKKLAFPLIAPIVIMLAIPFSILVGSRGAVGGLSLGVGLAVVYWATAALFEALGAVGQLPPIPSAWSPDFIFLFCGLYFFLRMPT